jgi:cysteine synthase
MSLARMLESGCLIMVGVALNMLAQEVDQSKTRTVIEYSSGSTVISLALASRIYHGIADARAFLSNKTSPAKLRLMQFFGLDVYAQTMRPKRYSG